MELVHGAKITEYCDTNQLGTRQRLELFTQVCHAIQHAHQKGIIHRDIKPSNILVSVQDGVATPKVIDFGIARAIEGRLTDNTMFTACDQFLGTPAYMSPEQAEGGPDLDTRSDIYSLGVLLCELLTGRTPFDTRKLLESGLYEMLRTLREDEPQAPSAILYALEPAALSALAAERGADSSRLIASLRGDLDWIVLKALAKDRQLRYDTVNGLAMDLQRFLDDEPVLARPPNRLYRFGKLVHRNKALFAAGAALVVALLAGFGTSMWLLVREHRARQEAEAARRNEARLGRLTDAKESISRAASLLTERKYQEAEALLARNPMATNEVSIEAAGVFISLGFWHANYQRWENSARFFALFARANQLDRSPKVPGEIVNILGAAPALLQGGDLTTYQQFREETISRYGQTADPVTAAMLVKASLLLPANETLLGRLQPLAAAIERAVAATGSRPAGDTFQVAHQALAMGLLEYRRGNYAKALEWNRRSLSYSDVCRSREAASHTLAAMANLQLGRRELAESEVARARSWLKAWFAREPGLRDPHHGSWMDWAVVQILEREAAALIEPASHAAAVTP
jgi:hypothetical protein